jgi:hypothetical protein
MHRPSHPHWVFTLKYLVRDTSHEASLHNRLRPVPSSHVRPNILRSLVFSYAFSQCSSITVRQTTCSSHTEWQANIMMPNYKECNE